MQIFHVCSSVKKCDKSCQECAAFQNSFSTFQRSLFSKKCLNCLGDMTSSTSVYLFMKKDKVKEKNIG